MLAASSFTLHDGEFVQGSRCLRRRFHPAARRSCSRRRRRCRHPTNRGRLASPVTPTSSQVMKLGATASLGRNPVGAGQPGTATGSTPRTPLNPPTTVGGGGPGDSTRPLHAAAPHSPRFSSASYGPVIPTKPSSAVRRDIAVVPPRPTIMLDRHRVWIRRSSPWMTSSAPIGIDIRYSKESTSTAVAGHRRHARPQPRAVTRRLCGMDFECFRLARITVSAVALRVCHGASVWDRGYVRPFTGRSMWSRMRVGLVHW